MAGGALQFLKAGSDVFKLILYCRGAVDTEELEDYRVPLKSSHKSNSSFHNSFRLKGGGDSEPCRVRPFKKTL